MDLSNQTDKVTRGQMAKFIANAYNLHQVMEKHDFPDVDSASDLAKYVDAIAEAKITIGNRRWHLWFW